jgi:hypothetical protein
MLGRSMKGFARICSSRYVPMFAFRIRLTDTGHSMYFEGKTRRMKEAVHGSCAARELEMWIKQEKWEGVALHHLIAIYCPGCDFLLLVQYCLNLPIP